MRGALFFKRSCLILLLPLLIAVAYGQARAEKLFSFGVVADVQYADKESGGRRDYRGSLEKLKQCVTFWNDQNISFAIQLGDLIDGNRNRNETSADLNRITEVLNKSKVPLRHVLGNHCLIAGLDEITARLNLAMPAYYSFVPVEGWRIVVLFSMEVSTSSPESSPFRAQAASFLRQHSQAQSYNGAISETQFEWLRMQFHSAASQSQRVLIFSHHPVLAESSTSSHLLWNHREVAGLISESGCVAALFAGHDHAGGYALRDGVHHVTLEGMVESPAGGNSFGVVEVYADSLVIRGNGKLTGRSLRLE